MNKEKGQVILVLVLVMTVALAIGISVVQRSLSDVSTSTKVEESSRAFSAAEAGIEKILACPTCGLVTDFTENQSSARVTSNDLLPATAPSGTRQDPFEYPLNPLSKEEVGQIWLADSDPNVKLPDCTAIDSDGHQPVCYTQSSLDVYWGNSTTDLAALELTLVYYDTASSKYISRKWYLDNPSAGRSSSNKFDTNADCNGFTVGSNPVPYRCKYTIGGTNGTFTDSPLQPKLMLLRARLLYNNNPQPFAVQPSSGATCGTPCSLPPQSRTLESVGTSGSTQRKVRMNQIYRMVPNYFDYAIFSVGQINK